MIGLVHLVWAPLGPSPLRRFVRSYRTYTSGVEHELVVLLNGIGLAKAATREALLSELGDTPYRLIELEHPMLDLDAYCESARLLEHDSVCFVNSYGEVLAERWLAVLADALADPQVGLVGASGSWESQAEWRRGGVTHWPQQLLSLARDRRDFPRFPNPHIRTSTFMIGRELLLDLELGRASNKRETYLLESGHASITCRIQRHGLRAVVVGRDGHSYETSDWPASETFRIGEQRNLLVADNQTREYDQARSRRRKLLSLDAWGAREGEESN